jgi:protein-disulfide isomerase
MGGKKLELLQPPKSWYKRWWGISILVFVGFVVIIAPFFIYQTYVIYQEVQLGTYISTSTFSEKPPYDMELIVDNLSPMIGNPEAKIVIVEFGDFNCPMCLRAHSEVRKMIANYSDDIQFYWRNFPVVKESSVDLALGGVCANQQDLFWPYHDVLFANQGTVTIGNMLEYAVSVGIDLEQFNKCLEHDLSLAQLRKDYYASGDAKVQGTPTFIVNGFKLQGVIPYETWENIIEKFKKVL